MKYYNNFNDLYNAQANNSKSVFNRYADDLGDAENVSFDNLMETYLPADGDGDSQIEKMVSGVSYLVARYLNAGECMNWRTDYDPWDDESLGSEYTDWLNGMGEDEDAFNFAQNHNLDLPVGYDLADIADIDEFNEQFDQSDIDNMVNALGSSNSAFSDWLSSYYEADDSSGNSLSGDVEDHNKFDKTEKAVVSADPRTSRFFESLRDAGTSSDYAKALNDLMDFVVSHASEYEGFKGWKFKDIPEEEVAGWFD